MPDDASPGRRPRGPAGRLSRIWRLVGDRPATGRSFLAIMIIASALAIGVTVWRLYSLANTGASKGGLASFRI